MSSDKNPNSDLPPFTPATSDPLLGGKHMAPPERPSGTPNSTIIRSAAPPDTVFAPAATIIEKADLAEQAHNLADEVSDLRTAAVALAKRTTRNGYVVTLTATGLILDIALSIVAFVLLHNQSATNNQIQAQQTQITGAVHERCALYALIIPSYRDATRQTSPLGPTGYDVAYRKLQASADTLKCGIPHVITP